MLKELFNRKCCIQLEKTEMKALEDPAEDAKEIELRVNDAVSWKKKENCLHVECTRKVGFVPACNFEITVTYSVEHYLKEKNALDHIEDAVIEKEVAEDASFYIQEKQGLMNRVSLIIAQLTSAFNGTPLILPPYYQEEELIL